MKNTMRKAMLSTIAMLVVAVMSLTGVTYAWFTASTEATVNGMTMEVAAAGAGLQVSKDGSAWGSTVSYDTAANEALIPVSTVNAVNFFKADANPDNTNITTTAAAETNYWTETLYIQNTGNDDIVIKLTGTVFAQNGENTANKTTFKAARVAIIQDLKVDDVEAGLKYIYGDESYLGVNGEGTFDSKATAGSETVKLGEVTNYKTNLNECTLTIPGQAADTSYQPVKYTVVVWLEGQDVECVNKNANAAFDVTLNFEVVQ